MSVEACFQEVARQIRNLVECDTVHLLLGCPVPELRHPLLKLFSANNYSSAGYAGSSNTIALLQQQRVRALCDGAIQTGQFQSFEQAHIIVNSTEVQSIAIAPLERPAGVLGILLLTDSRTNAFNYGERLLLQYFLPQVAQNLERDMRTLCAMPLRSKPDHKGERTPQRTDLQPMQQVSVGTMPQSGQQAVEYTQVQFQLNELDRLKNEFISMVSHELRVPLTAIKGYTVLLQAYGVTADPGESNGEEMSLAHQQEYLNRIMEQTRHLEVLISDLLDVSRIHAGHLSLHCGQVDLAALCQRVIHLMQQQVDLQYPVHYKMDCTLPPDLSMVWADTDRLQQILINLLENAVKYSPGGGLIEVIVSKNLAPSGLFIDSSPSQELCTPSGIGNSQSQEPLMMYIMVRDHGIGISSDQQIHLFRPFSRLEQPLTESIPGAGLGLYITRKLVEAMGGSITLSSSTGVGTCVTFSLPIKSPAEKLSLSTC